MSNTMALAGATATPDSVNPIAPEFKFRISIDEIRAYYQSLDDAFEDGAYLLCAEYAERNSELEGCGLILGGALGRGLAILNALPTLTARGLVCKAFGEWSLGQDIAARGTLAKVPTGTSYSERARALLALIDKDQITVFVTAAFLPVPGIATVADSARAAEHRYGSFVLKHVGSQLSTNSYDYEPHQPFDRFIEELPAEERPDFIFAMTPMWLVPRNIESVAIPKVIWCHDTDVFIYRALDNLALYDVRIVNTSQEHFELGRATQNLCISNLLSDPLNAQFPPCRSNAEKEFDVLFTGSSFDSFHSEKARFLYNLAALGDDYKIRVVDGHLSQAEYYDLLTRTKFLPIVNRYAGCPSPRWRDALTNSAYVLYPQGTAYGKAFPGCFPVGTSNVADDVRSHLEKYDAGDPAYDLSRTVIEIDKEFAVLHVGRDKLIERQLKLAAFCALVLHPSRKSPPSVSKGRPVWLTPCIDPVIYGRHNIRKKIAKIADSFEAADRLDAKDINNLAHLYGQLALIFWEVPEVTKWRARADESFAEGCQRHPRSLALHFNRAHWTFLRPGADRAEAAKMFKELLDRWDSFQYEPLNNDIGLAYVLGDRDCGFPYYAYAQLVTSYAQTQGARPTSASLDIQQLRNVLKGAAYGYIGWEAIERERFDEGFGAVRRALDLNADNLPLLRSSLEWILGYCERFPDTPSALASKACDIFLAGVNLYPAMLLTHTHRVCALFVRAQRTEDLRHLLQAWYQLGNITHSTTPGVRLAAERNRFREIYCFASYLPPRLLRRLDLVSTNEAIELTQFESMVLDGRKRHAGEIRRQQRPILYLPHRVLVWVINVSMRAKGALERRPMSPAQRRMVAAVIRLFPGLDELREAYLRARIRDPYSEIDKPSLAQKIVFRLTLLYRRVRNTL